MKKALALVALLMFTACSSAMSTTGEYSIDTTAYTALASEKLVLKYGVEHPCATNSLCVSKDLAQTLHDARVMLMAALVNYQGARDAYLASVAAGGAPDDAAVASAHYALQSAISNANTVLALETVQKIIAFIKE